MESEVKCSCPRCGRTIHLKFNMVVPPPKKEMDHVRQGMIVHKFMDGQTMQQIADQYDISRERVRQILKSAGISGEDGGLGTLRAREREARRLAARICTRCKKAPLIGNQSKYCTGCAKIVITQKAVARNKKRRRTTKLETALKVRDALVDALSTKAEPNA